MFHKFYWIGGIHSKPFFVSSRNGFFLWKTRCVTPISLQATVMRIKKSLYFLTESLMPSIAGRFYHFREHVFQKETRVDSSIIFQHVPENTDSSQIPSLPRSSFWDVTQRSGSVAWHPKNGCDGEYQIPGKNKKEKRLLTEIHSSCR